MNWFWDRILATMKRRQRTVNRADPTLIVTYDHTGPLVALSITIGWGVEVHLTLRGDDATQEHQWRWYDAPFWTWVVNHLEDAYERQQSQYDEDPMGRLGDYE